MVTTNKGKKRKHSQEAGTGEKSLQVGVLEKIGVKPKRITKAEYEQRLSAASEAQKSGR